LTSTTRAIWQKIKTDYKSQLLLLAFFAFLLYANTIFHGYAFDDMVVIVNNRHTQMGLKGIPTIFSSGYRSGSGPHHYGYRPLSIFTFALEYEFFEHNPHVSHLINVLLFVFAAILLFLTLRAIVESPVKSSYSSIKEIYYDWLPFVATVLFVSHPIHTEVVANLKSRDELLCFLGLISSLFYLLKYLKVQNYRFLIVSGFSFLLALISKESALSFIVVIPLSIFFFSKFPIKKYPKILTIYILAIGVFFSIRALVLGNLVIGSIRLDIFNNSLKFAENIWQTWATILFVLGKYIKLLIIPHPLVHTYSYNMVPLTGFTDPVVILSLFVHLCLFFFALLYLRKKSLFSYGILFYLIMLSIVSNIFILISENMAERFLFAPSLGFCLVIALIFIKTINFLHHKKRLFKILFLSGFILIVALFSLKTITRNRAWKNNEVLFSTDIKNAENSAMARLFYGLELSKKISGSSSVEEKNKLFDKAIVQIESAIKINPKYHLAYFSLGEMYAKVNALDLSIVNYKQALDLDINNEHYKSALSLTYYKAGLFYLNTKKHKQAINNFSNSINYNPKFPDVYNNLGIAYAENGDYPKAISAVEKAVKLSPRDIRFYFNLGVIYEKSKSYQKASEYYRRVTEIDARFAGAFHRLGLIYKKMGQTKTANEYLTRAYFLDPKLKQKNDDGK